ncbi:hypothetical protein HanRHA438_Chr09g0381551 [Helianthus annuus]|nr:hypothetical protein HanRHA438_Chr09g0381551 [Helianthus annuus]
MCVMLKLSIVKRGRCRRLEESSVRTTITRQYGFDIFCSSKSCLICSSNYDAMFFNCLPSKIVQVK